MCVIVHRSAQTSSSFWAARPRHIRLISSGFMPTPAISACDDHTKPQFGARNRLVNLVGSDQRSTEGDE